MGHDIQAARGTVTSPVRAPGRRHRSVVAGVFVLAYAADQVTKVLAVHHLASGRSRPWLGDMLRLHLTRNAGAAFSTGTTYTWVFACLAVVAVVVVLWLARRVGSPLWAMAFGLLLAGIGGNLTDRLVRSPGPLRGQVVDFLELPHWPIFNVADVCINLAAALVLVQVFRARRLDGTRADDGAQDPVVGGQGT